MFEHLHLKQSRSEFLSKSKLAAEPGWNERVSRGPLQIEKVISDFDTRRFIYYLIQCSRFILNLKYSASHLLHDDVMFYPVTRLNTPEIKSKIEYLFGVLKMNWNSYARYQSLQLLLIQNIDTLTVANK